jgi:MFS family permease
LNILFFKVNFTCPYHAGSCNIKSILMQWTKKQALIIIIVAITSFMATFLISSINIALPAIEKSFRLNAISLSWVVTSFLLATAMFLLPMGRWGDLTGIKRLFKSGVVIFTLSSLVCGFSGSGMWLIVFRFVQGVGAALTSTSGPAILVSAFLPQHRGRVLGIAVSAVYLGLAFGPFAGGFMTQYWGWRSIFYVASILGVFTSLFAFMYLEYDEISQEKTRKIDLKGTLFYMAGLVALVYGSSSIPSSRGWFAVGRRYAGTGDFLVA